MTTSAERSAVPGSRARGALCALLLASFALGCGDDSPSGTSPDAAPRAADAGKRRAERDGGADPRSPDRARDAGGVSGDGGGGDGGEPDPVLPPLPTCDERFGLLRVAAWPGGGVQIALAPSEGSGELSLVREHDRPTAVALRAHPQANGSTLLAIVPSEDADEHARRLAAARALIDELPEAERIALAVLSTGSPLAADLTEQRAHVLARLAAIPPSAPVPQPQLLDDFAALGERLRRVSADWGPLARTAILIGAADLDGRALAQSILARREGIVLLGACGPFTAGEPLTLVLGAMRCELAAPAPIEEHARFSCDAHMAAADDYPFADLIELELTAEELALHDEYSAAQSEAVFSLRVVLGASAPIEATAHFRGQTSLNCERKNYSINLQGPRARRIAPGIAGDQFYLISMCKDASYFRQLVASEMMRPLGLFPLDQRYVRLRVGGQERGVYLLLEKPEDSAIADHLAVTAVVRRRLEAQDKQPDIEYPDDPAAAEVARAQYESLAALIDQTAPEQLDVALGERMDFDAYLRWLAINSYLQCGDSADELFFYASDEPAVPGGGAYFRMHGWDSDDLFLPCHHGGRFAIQDAASVAYCAESNLDRALLASDAVEARFVDLLDELMTDIWPLEAIEPLLARTREQLFEQLQDDAVCSAMSELVATDPEAVSCARMQADLDDAFAVFHDNVMVRATTLREAIDAWRSAR